MKPILIIQSSDSVTAGNFIDYLNQNAVSYQLFHTYYNEAFPDLENFDAVINLGCPYSVSDYREHEHLKNLYAYVADIVKINKPYLGICYGAQLLAKILGAIVEPNKVKELGAYKVTITDDGMTDSLFKNFPKEFTTFQWHGETFKIPFGATQLATSKDCTNQAFRKNNAIGVQFHLETGLVEMLSWSDECPDDLKNMHITKDDITESFKENSEIVQANSFRLLENFLSTIK